MNEHVMLIVQIISVTGFVLVHVFTGRLRFLEKLPRSRWLSFAGGTSVAYVFLHVFPELDEAQMQIEEGFKLLVFLEHHAYLVAVAGLSFFYGLERLITLEHGKNNRRKPPSGEHDIENQGGIFWLHILSFGLYNALVGYLLVHREHENLRQTVFYFIAMTMHFVVNDFGLREHHKQSYHDVGRWVLAAAVFFGWGLGRATQISEGALGLLFALLAGAVILNVLKEELPKERESRFFPFISGVVLFSVLMMLP